MQLLERGMTNPQIAETLGITLDGAKYHVSQVLSKLGASSREEAAGLELRAGSRRGWLAWPLVAKAAGGRLCWQRWPAWHCSRWRALKSGTDGASSDGGGSLAGGSLPAECPVVDPSFFDATVIGRAGPVFRPSVTPSPVPGFTVSVRFAIAVEVERLWYNGLAFQPESSGEPFVAVFNATTLQPPDEPTEGRCVAIGVRLQGYSCGPLCDAAGYVVQSIEIGDPLP